MVRYLWGKQKADSISGHMSDSIVSLIGTPSILLPTSEGPRENLEEEESLPLIEISAEDEPDSRDNYGKGRLLKEFDDESSE